MLYNSHKKYLRWQGLERTDKKEKEKKEKKCVVWNTWRENRCYLVVKKADGGRRIAKRAHDESIVGSSFIGREKIFYTRCIIHARPDETTCPYVWIHGTPLRAIPFCRSWIWLYSTSRRGEFLTVSRHSIWRSSHAGFMRLRCGLVFVNEIPWSHSWNVYPTTL